MRINKRCNSKCPMLLRRRTFRNNVQRRETCCARGACDGQCAIVPNSRNAVDSSESRSFDNDLIATFVIRARVRDGERVVVSARVRDCEDSAVRPTARRLHYCQRRSDAALNSSVLRATVFLSLIHNCIQTQLNGR